jgi:hypothetical protein
VQKGVKGRQIWRNCAQLPEIDQKIANYWAILGTMGISSADMNDSATDTQPSELEIVDTFTKLIFGAEQEYTVTELGIIGVLRLVDDNVALDRVEDMGIYLRALGVNEMISLVSRVRRDYPLQVQTHIPASQHPRARF